MRCAFNIAYNGTHYLGSQSQTQTPNTILGNLQKVCTQLGIHSKIIASGRTDKGVHATGQVCHIDLPNFWSDTKKLKRVLNQMLPPSIRITNSKRVSDVFHARYDAKRRTYRYIFKIRPTNPFESDFITFEQNINFKEIQKNISLFIGQHDFQQFMKTGSDVSSTQRIIYKAFAYKYKNLIILNFQANGFLRSQIRLMVGALLQLNSTQIDEQLSCSNTYKIKPAPSNGLYLAKINY